MAIIVRTHEASLIVDGVEYYKIGIVSEITGKSSQMIRLWDIWSDELALNGSERLIPKSFRHGKHSTRYWTDDEIEKIVEFSRNLKYGDIAQFSRNQWGERGKNLTKDLSTEARKEKKVYRANVNRTSRKIQRERRIEQIKIARGNMLRAVRIKARRIVDSVHDQL